MNSGGRIVIVDDQVSYADALALAVSLTDDLTVVGRAADTAEFETLVDELAPDLVVCDYRLTGGETGTATVGRLRERGFDGPAMILTSYPAPQVRREAAELDRVVVMSKEAPVTEIVGTLRSLAAGRIPIDGDPGDEPSLLSAGELEVLELLGQGRNPTEIAGRLYLSIHTIRARIKSIHRKLEVTSQVEAIAEATRLGLLVPPS